MNRIVRLIMLALIVSLLDMGAHAELEIWFLDVGEADCSIIMCDSEAMLIDGGNAEDSALVYSCLKNTLSITDLKAIISTHPHEDHIGGIAGALNACKVERIYSPVLQYENGEYFNTMTKYADLQNTEICVPQIGDTFALGGADIRFVSPRNEHEDMNDDSIVVQIRYGAVSILFCADAGIAAEEEMISSGLNIRSDVLRIGHHGSNSSTSQQFLSAVDPLYAVISVGRDNDHNHPSEKVLSRLEDAGITVYRTDQQGTIVMHSDGTGIVFDQVQTGESEKYESAFIGNIRSMKVHRSSCKWVYSIGPSNRVPFDSAADAFAKGFDACGGCKPRS